MTTIPLTWAKPPLTGNDRDERKHGGFRKFADTKEQARWAIRKANPAAVFGANVTLHWRIPTRHRRDPDNLGATLKACLDALVAEGVLPDDSWVHVPRAACEIHPPNGEPAAMWLEIEELR